MGLKVTNNAFGTLNAGITNSSTTIVLQAGEGARFPTLGAGDYFYATLIDTTNNLEIVKVTARSTDTMTVVRAQDNTTARAFSTNDRFELRPTAALFNDVIATSASAVQKSGDTMTGALNVPSGATGTQVPQVQEVVKKSGDTMTGALEVTNGKLYVNSQSSGATAAKMQCITGSTTAAGSGVYKKIVHVGETHSLRVNIIAVSGNDVASLSAVMNTCYGSNSVTTIATHSYGALSSPGIQYNNGGSPNYTLDFRVTYSGSTPTVYWNVEGVSRADMFNV